MSSVFGARRFDRSPATAGLIVGDLLVILTLLWFGSLRHDNNPVEVPLVFADTVAPFLVGWIVASVVAGAYSVRARGSIRSAVLYAAGTWIIAALIGAGLRATSLFHGNSPLTFVLVVTGFGLILFVIWRGLAATVTQ